MNLTSKTFVMEPIIYDIDILSKEYPQYFNYLSTDELQPDKIILCSNLNLRKIDSIDKILLLYSKRLIILKNINDTILKNIVDYTDINYVISEGMPNPSSITIEYRADGRERFFFDTKATTLVEALVTDFRKFTTTKVDIQTVEKIPMITFSDLQENKYIGATIAKKAVMDKNKVICSLKQRRIFDLSWWFFRNIVTQAHFTVICQNEIIIFWENRSAKRKRGICGDLIFISIGALKNASIEATGKGMILRYLFKTDRKLEFFYENERTDELLKIMSFINGTISK